MIDNIREQARLFFNRVRIWWLKAFTNRVREVLIKDEATGKEIKATTVSEEEKFCQHQKIEQVYGTFWRCMECPDVWFEISYKVALTQQDLLGLIEKLADVLRQPSPLTSEHDLEEPKA